MTARIDRTGQRFGRLVVVEPAPSTGTGARWSCICDCGGRAVVLGSNLACGGTRSCGCLRAENNRAMGRLAWRRKRERDAAKRSAA